MNNGLIFGHPVEWWNLRCCLQGAEQADIELAAVGHRCGHFRHHMGPFLNADYGLAMDFNRMTALQRLQSHYDLYAPCCKFMDTPEPRGRKRTVAEVLRDQKREEVTSVRVAGMTPRQLIRAAQVEGKAGWQ